MDPGPNGQRAQEHGCRLDVHSNVVDQIFSFLGCLLCVQDYVAVLPSDRRACLPLLHGEEKQAVSAPGAACGLIDLAGFELEELEKST